MHWPFVRANQGIGDSVRFIYRTVIRSYVIANILGANGNTKNKNKLTEGKAFNFSHP